MLRHVSPGPRRARRPDSSADQRHTPIFSPIFNSMGVEQSRLTDEAELAMFKSSLEDIKSRFASLLISVREALEANHYPTGDVRSILVGMFAGSDESVTYQELT